MKTASPLTFSSGSGSKFSIHIGLSLWVENHRGDVVGGEERLELSLNHCRSRHAAYQACFIGYQTSMSREPGPVVSVCFTPAGTTVPSPGTTFRW